MMFVASLWTLLALSGQGAPGWRTYESPECRFQFQHPNETTVVSGRAGDEECTGTLSIYDAKGHTLLAIEARKLKRDEDLTSWAKKQARDIVFDGNCSTWAIASTLKSESFVVDGQPACATRVMLEDSCVEPELPGEHRELHLRLPRPSSIVLSFRDHGDAARARRVASTFKFKGYRPLPSAQIEEQRKRSAVMEKIAQVRSHASVWENYTVLGGVLCYGPDEKELVRLDGSNPNQNYPFEVHGREVFWIHRIEKPVLRDELRVLHLDTKKSETIIEEPGLDFRVSPDGKQIAVGLDASLVIYDRATKTQTIIATSTEDEGENPWDIKGWSKDGRELSFDVGQIDVSRKCIYTDKMLFCHPQEE